jgi:hypothetical protein
MDGMSYQEKIYTQIIRIWLNDFFGLHKPRPEILHNSKELSKIYCNKTNIFILKPKKDNSIKII